MSVSTTSRSEFMCDECYIASARLVENILFKLVDIYVYIMCFR